MNRINLYFRLPPTGYRWIPGDRRVFNWIRRLSGFKKTSGLERVFINLRKGFDELGIDYLINPPFKNICPGEPVVVLGLGRQCLQGYANSNPVIAGIGLMTHPSEWPDLCVTYPVVRYLQHSEWANAVYVPYFGSERCTTWPAGIDTVKWAPDPERVTKFDILIYHKIRWDQEQTNKELTTPILEHLERSGLLCRNIFYGKYNEAEYLSLLKHCRAMIFFCEHESQGLACCEALSMNVPVFAWDQGFMLDPERFKWKAPFVKATSVPFFDQRCGARFADFKDFKENFDLFWEGVQSVHFHPRTYILENLTLKKSAMRMLEVINGVYP